MCPKRKTKQKYSSQYLVGVLLFFFATNISPFWSANSFQGIKFVATSGLM